MFANITQTNNTSNDWNGVIFCHGAKGWYPSAVFHEKNAPCSFQRVQALTSIDYLNAYLTQAMGKKILWFLFDVRNSYKLFSRGGYFSDDKIQPYKEPTCDGVRCKIGQCIPCDRVCDGVQDCRDGFDEHVKNCSKLKELRQNNDIKSISMGS